jgi:hypothetical protein
MIYPTMSMLTSGAIIVAVLLAVDWVVWGMTYVNALRYSQPAKPRGACDVVAGEASMMTAVCISAENDGHGFKKVA